VIKMAMMTTTKFKISPTAPITEKQQGWIKKLADEKDWSEAPLDVSLAIRKIRRAKDGELADVLRLTASKTIDFLLAPTTPKAVVAAPAPGYSTDQEAGALLDAVTGSAPSYTSQNIWLELNMKLETLPTSKYAIPLSDTNPNDLLFVEVVERKTTKKRYINKLIGAPGDWKRVFGWTDADKQLAIAKQIAEDPTKYVKIYCQKFTRCSCCDSPLSVAKSIAAAMGPVCSKKFQW
jgi:Family of unknown function (DUF6011)